ncbi:MAG TPA: hypothetical protein VEV44_17860 [Pseudoneobacillus sp.]|nr:hypothetical protein [Pseudoneobacillus sp.]
MKKLFYVLAFTALIATSGFTVTSNIDKNVQNVAELPSVYSTELPSVYTAELPSVYKMNSSSALFAELPSVYSTKQSVLLAELPSVYKTNNTLKL